MTHIDEGVTTTHIGNRTHVVREVTVTHHIDERVTTTHIGNRTHIVRKVTVTHIDEGVTTLESVTVPTLLEKLP